MAVAVAACAGEPSGTPLPTAERTTARPATDSGGQASMGSVSFERVLQGTSNASQLDGAAIIPLWSPEEAGGIAAQIGSEEASTALLAQDYERYTVVLVLRGQQPSSGYSIQVQSVDLDAGEVRVTARLEDGQGAGLTVITYPFDIIRIDEREIPEDRQAHWVLVDTQGQWLADSGAGP